MLKFIMILILKFRRSEKGKKFKKKSSTFNLTLLSSFKFQVEDFFQILWPSQNILTLLDAYQKTACSKGQVISETWFSNTVSKQILKNVLILCPFCEVANTSWPRLHCFNITVSVDTINHTFWFVVKPFLFLVRKINVKWPLMER